MRLVLQRVSRAAVTIEGADRRKIGSGLMILVGFTTGDTPAMCDRLAKKSVELRIFEDDAGAMNRSLLEVGGACLIVSQFTLYANSRKGRRPSFIEAAPPAEAIPLYECFIHAVREQGFVPNSKGGELMLKLVTLTNEYELQLRDMMDGWTATGEKIIPYSIRRIDYKSFNEYICGFHEELKGLPDFVPATTLLCLDTKRNIFVGAVNIQHYLNNDLLFNGGHIAVF